MGSNEDDGPTGEHQPGFQKWLDAGKKPKLLPPRSKQKHSAVETAKEHVAPSPMSLRCSRALRNILHSIRNLSDSLINSYRMVETLTNGLDDQVNDTPKIT
jgi:hypothetical protein